MVLQFILKAFVTSTTQYFINKLLQQGCWQFVRFVSVFADKGVKILTYMSVRGIRRRTAPQLGSKPRATSSSLEALHMPWCLCFAFWVDTAWLFSFLCLLNQCLLYCYHNQQYPDERVIVLVGSMNGTRFDESVDNGQQARIFF